MLKDKEILMLSHFRNNSRISLTKLSKLTKIPVSTIFDKLKDYERKNLIKKHTSLIDFRKLGYEIRTQILITAEKEKRDPLQNFLVNHPRINTVYRINNGFDFLTEAIFRNMNELDEFMISLDEYNPKQKKEFFIMEDIKREEFMTHKENLGITR